MLLFLQMMCPATLRWTCVVMRSVPRIPTMDGSGGMELPPSRDPGEMPLLMQVCMVIYIAYTEKPFDILPLKADAKNYLTKKTVESPGDKNKNKLKL